MPFTPLFRGNGDVNYYLNSSINIKNVSAAAGGELLGHALSTGTHLVNNPVGFRNTVFAGFRPLPYGMHFFIGSFGQAAVFRHKRFNFHGGLASPRRQRTNFVGNHGKPPAVCSQGYLKSCCLEISVGWGTKRKKAGAFPAKLYGTVSGIDHVG